MHNYSLSQILFPLNLVNMTDFLYFPAFCRTFLHIFSFHFRKKVLQYTYNVLPCRIIIRKGETNMKKWLKKILGLAAVGGAAAGALYYFKKKNENEDDDFEDDFEDEDFDLDNDLKPVADREYVPLNSASKSSDEEADKKEEKAAENAGEKEEKAAEDAGEEKTEKANSAKEVSEEKEEAPKAEK